MLLIPLILVMLGAGLLGVGRQGLRAKLGNQAEAVLGEVELKRRRMILRIGGYACVASGSALVVLALFITYEVLALISDGPPGLRAIMW